MADIEFNANILFFVVFLFRLYPFLFIHLNVVIERIRTYTYLKWKTSRNRFSINDVSVNRHASGIWNNWKESTPRSQTFMLILGFNIYLTNNWCYRRVNETFRAEKNKNAKFHTQFRILYIYLYILAIDFIIIFKYLQYFFQVFLSSVVVSLFYESTRIHIFI